MANWHALTGDVNGNSYSIAYHVPIPSANNRSGINYRTALINSGLGGKTSLPDGDGTGGTISATEKTSITTGTLIEVVEPFATNPGETITQLVVRLNARYTALADVSGVFIVGLAHQLDYYGGAAS